MNAGFREALAHLGRGFAELPVHPDKTPRSDLIRRTRGTPGWGQLRKKPATATELHDWFEMDPTVGVGVLTGEVSNAVVVDVDDARRAPNVPATATVTTQRGFHAYFRPNGHVRTREFPWGEIRGERAYVVAPCSRRADGGAYAWELTPEDAGFADFAAFENTAITTYIRTTCFKRTTCLGSEFEGLRALADLERDEYVALRLAGALGAPADVAIGESFPCLIHADANPSASLWRYEDDAPVLYRDWHAEKHGGDRWLPLARVRALIAGRTQPLGPPELAIWKLRLAHEAGLLEPVAFERPVAPGRRIEDVWGGFLDLLALRWTVTPDAPAPYSARFAASWCGVSTHRAHEAIGALARAGSLRLVGRDPRGTRLWLPEGVVPVD